MTRKPPTYLSFGQLADLTGRYAAGENTMTIAKDFGVSVSMVCRRASRAGHGKRGSCVGVLTSLQKEDATKRYIRGESLESIGRSMGVTGAAIGAIAKKRGASMRPIDIANRTRSINDAAFSIPTPESAYWAGFLMADGCIRKNRSGVQLSVAPADIKHIVKFRDFLGSDHKIVTQRPAPSSTPKTTGKVGIEISSRQIQADLAKFGVTPKKSKTAQVCGLEMDRDFWRGMIDGDGCISTKPSTGDPSINLVGTLGVVSAFLAFAKTIDQKVGAKTHKRGSTFGVTIGNRRAYNIIRHLYTEASVALDRKAAIAARIIADKEVDYQVGRRRKHHYQVP